MWAHVSASTISQVQVPISLLLGSLEIIAWKSFYLCLDSASNLNSVTQKILELPSQICHLLLAILVKGTVLVAQSYPTLWTVAY